MSMFLRLYNFLIDKIFLGGFFFWVIFYLFFWIIGYGWIYFLFITPFSFLNITIDSFFQFLILGYLLIVIPFFVFKNSLNLLKIQKRSFFVKICFCVINLFFIFFSLYFLYNFLLKYLMIG